MRAALDNGQRSPRKLLAAVVRKLVTGDAAISLRQTIGPTAPGRSQGPLTLRSTVGPETHTPAATNWIGKLVERPLRDTCRVGARGVELRGTDCP